MASPDDDQGSAELAVATPLLLLLMLFVIQTALWAHGDHLAAAIARQSAEAARTADGASGQASAEAVADELGGSLLVERTVTVERGETEVRAVVQARVTSLIPGLTWPVRQELSVPVERFVPPEPQTGVQP
ncbi:TadE/TadG family type IV pilus assembly protein [Nocardiopsis aegyptia]|uniref:Flp pilus assembly protein TadG n=1 Tax=Nocardiopsis aegyptia TaxID=220378 RepID=A0A7Z0ETB9_9ACTN|nr:TadE/TadG family type IV pilus assembly protein [Nocardiopsis aegyptia]NYJ37919.1 Flp pilus assembly protein TadG [Nocardiopsis aegyptia]